MSPGCSSSEKGQSESRFLQRNETESFGCCLEDEMLRRAVAVVIEASKISATIAECPVEILDLWVPFEDARSYSTMAGE